MRNSFHILHSSFFIFLALFMGMSSAAWGDTWDGTVGTMPTIGKGTAASPYEIGDAKTFAWFMKQVAGGSAASASKAYGNKYWVLTADIDLNNKEWNAYGSSQSAFLGHFDGGGHTISNMSLAPSTKKTQHGLFGNISGTSKTVRSEVKNLTIASSSFNPTTNLTGRSCGFLCGYSRYADITNVTVTGCAFNMGTNVFGTGASYVGGVVGQVNLSVTVRNCTVTGFTFSCSANMTKLSLGGIAGYCNASSSTPFTIEGCSVNTPTFTIGTTSNNQLNGCNIGGILGSGGAGLNMYDNKVTTPQMTIYAKVTGSSYIAGGIGTTGSYSNIDGLHISGGYIKDALASGASDFISITASQEFVVAGAIAKVTNGGTASGAANVVKNVAVTGMKFDLPHHNAATGVTSTNKFVVGAVMGYISSPNVDPSGRCAIPENIVSKGVTLYAPYAITSAVVGTSGTSAGIDNYHDDGRGGLDQLQKSQHDTWFYSDYKLGLSNDVLTHSNIIEYGAATEQTAKVERNYLSSSVETNTDASISAPSLLNMTGTTFQHKPGYSDHEFDGGTVLWWNQASGTANDNTQQAFYPLDAATGRLCTSGGKSGGTYPYFMYFFQGVNHGTYVEPADATNIINGIDANYTLMTDNATLTTPTVLTISDPDGTAKKRGFDAHTISVEATDGGSYTYKWYVNGVEQSETGTSISVKPDWRYSKSIMVIATPLEGTGGATSASYTLRHGVLKTKNTEGTDYVGMSYAERGTSDNPYIIDCPEALKQWSYLSTYCTAYNYEGTQSGATVAFNQSYFVLGADIDLGIGTTDEEKAANPGELIPIGHCGMSQDGTRGTVNQNFVFCGHFEGNGHTIKNFKIKWKGATINSGGKYIYYGFFGALGWGEAAATQSCVVQNLILENGHLVHDNTNRSLYYEGTTHSNNVCIGMLAGLASQYTTVRNVEVRNCSIDDNEDTEDYYLAGSQLTVGGMIGRIQGAITANNMDFGSSIVTNFLSSNCDITLKHAAYKNKSTASDSFTEYDTNSLVRLFTVGGVVGSIYSASAAFSASNMPQYIYYTGKIDARRAFVAPDFASADYSGITGNNYEDYWKHFMVNASPNTTQEIPNLYYGNFQIQDYSSDDAGTTQTITNSYPATTCSADGGSRTIVAHNDSHPNTYNFYTANNKYYGAYQGVNYGTLVESGDRAALELEIAAAKNSIEEISSWYLVFDGDQLQLTDHMPEKLSLQDLVSGNTHTVTVINTATDADAYSYEWYINGVKSTEITTTTRSVDFTPGTTPRLIYVKAIKNDSEKKTDVVDIPRGITSISASYSPQRENQVVGEFDGVFTVTPDNNALAFGGDNLTYVWNEWKNASQETKTYTEETAWAANQPHIISFKDKGGNDVAKADWTYAKSIDTDNYTVVYGDTVTQNITEGEYTALDATEQAKCTANGDDENTYSYTHVVSYTPVTVGQEYTVYHTGEYGDLTDGTTYTSPGETSTTTDAKRTKTYQCTVTATDAAWKAFLDDADRTSQYSSYSTDLSKLYSSTLTYTLIVRLKKSIVVWLHPNSTTAEYDIPAGKDDWTIGTEGGEVGDKAHPVRTWGKAYSLLDGSEGVDWDFNKIVLVGTSDALTTNGFGASPGEGEHGNGTGKEYRLGDISWYGLSNVFSEGTNGLQKTESAPSYDEYMAKIAQSPMAKNVTITGKYDGVDYHGAITSPQIASYDKPICGNDVGKPVQRWFNMLGDTKFEYLTFIGCKDASYDSFFGHYHDIWFGEGLIMKNFCGDSSGYGTIATVSTPRFDIWGGLHNDERFSLYDGKNGELLRMQEKFMPHGKKGFTMTFRSGYYSIICTGSRETESAGIQGSPKMPIKCTIDVDLDQEWNDEGEHPKTMANATSTPYDVGIILSGNHEGPMFADIDINVKSGRVARVVNGSLGANTPSQYVYGNGKLSYPYNNFMGRTNVVLEPAKSRFATGGEDAVTTNARVVVTEVYNGSVGRAWADNLQEIEMASLGHFNITMNGGTIGFPHTTTYWDDTALDKLKASNQVYCGIYGGGAGGMIGIGYGDYDSSDAAFTKPHSYTKEKFLPYWDENHVCPYYSPYSLYKDYIAKDNPRHLFINCYNADTDDYTDVDPADTKSVITINGGVIGSAEKPANIFGAGSGFTSTWFLRQSNYPNLTSGVVYGTSKKDSVVTLNIKGNTVIYGNVYGAGKGTDYYYTHYRTGTQVFSGNKETAQNFTFLGQTYGSAVVNISESAVIHGNVYGGGAGVAEAKFVGSTDTYTQMTQTALLTGNATVNISDNAQIKTYDVTTGTGDAAVTKTYGGNVYGGGMLALVDSTTNVNISGNVRVEGSVYGGSQGIDNTTNEVDNPQTISGTKEETYNLYHAENARLFGVLNDRVNVNVSGSPTILGDIYGGSQCAIINGSTNVTINGGTLGKTSPTAADIANRTTGGNIYGGGHGVVDSDGITIKASADVSDTTNVTINSAKYADAKTRYYVYGGGNLACKVDSATNVTMNSAVGSKQTDVFGAGNGQNTYCKDTYVTINGESGDTCMYRNVYGGGNLGYVSDSTRVSVIGGKVYGNVFGGGAGTIASSGYGFVRGNTNVYVNQNAHIHGNVYGGGDIASVGEYRPSSLIQPRTYVCVTGGNVFGEVYGGGNGVTKAEAESLGYDYSAYGRVYCDTRVRIANSIETDSLGKESKVEPYVWNHIYGGGSYGTVNGNTKVWIEGGNIGADVYGGGKGEVSGATSANVLGNTNVQIDGGSVIWSKYANANDSIIGWTAAKTKTDTINVNGQYVGACIQWKANGKLKENLAKYITDSNFYDLEKGKFNVDHNIYGGGRYACVVGYYYGNVAVDSTASVTSEGTGVANVILNHSLVTDKSLLDTKTVAGACWYSVIDSIKTPQFAVFGGGYGAKTKVYQTNVVSQMGKENALGANTDYAAFYADTLVWNNYEKSLKSDWEEVDESTRKSLYGGIDENSFCRYRASRYAWSSGIPSATYLFYFGGGYSGYVAGNTNLEFSDHSALRTVFGGGLGAIKGSSVGSVDTFTGDETFGQVGGNTNINIRRAVVSNNVFGGGGGVESVKQNDSDYTDFARMARVLGKTYVTIDGGMDSTLVFGHVYGGGDVANVYGGDGNGDATNVIIRGGSVFSQVHAGGNGRTASQCKDYTKLGAIYGNAHVEVDSTATTTPWLWNRVYGGGENGTVYGNTIVNINGGHIGHDIFGGGWGDISVVDGDSIITSADVKGNTYVNIKGGEVIADQMWKGETARTWASATTKNGTTYCAQYDTDSRKFYIYHNIYGGGNVACAVDSSTHVNVTHGLISGTTSVGHSVKNGFFNSDEWKQVYNKLGSPHFGIFGAGYGENTKVDSTYVEVNLPAGRELTAADSEEDGSLKSNLFDIFYSNQSVMDIVGGGYSGSVTGATNVSVSGDTYARRVLGGGFYAPVGASNVSIASINCDEIFGGGLMGDVKSNAIVAIGASDGTNDKIFINKSIYGGNDVSGNIYDSGTLNIYGGKIYGNIYGAGNGDYLYAQGVNGEKHVTVNEYYKSSQGNIYDLVYTVPRNNDFMPSADTPTSVQKMVNINSYRPKLQNVNINLFGTSEGNVTVLGSVFGGGNSASVANLTGKPVVNLYFGSNLNIGNVYLGCDGDAMFDNTSDFMGSFQDINGLSLSDTIKWSTAGNISTQYLDVSPENRPIVYPHFIDLYFAPVEMSVQPTVTWASDMHDVTIGSFICGGNRGNMNVEPDANGNIVDITFPDSLTITNRIVGGCNNANLTIDEGNIKVKHTGGYLLGSRGGAAEIKLNVNCNFDPQKAKGKTYKEGANVYGGCYKTGVINGDISVDVRSDMLKNLEGTELADAMAVEGVSLCSVYGAGYGNESYVYGSDTISLGRGVKKSADGTVPASVNYIYGGGQQGNLIGNSTIRIYNGHVASSLCGGSYAGYMWGSTQLLVGYPKYFVAQKSGVYGLQRTDKWNSKVKNLDGSDVVKTTINLMAGDIVSEEVHDAICSVTDTVGVTTVLDASALSSYLTEKVTEPGDAGLTWDDVDIQVDEAVYGGGYSLASSTMTASGTYTVRKYESAQNLNDDCDFGTNGYGGNTTVLVWDAPSDEAYDVDHVAISSQTMKAIKLADGTDLNGYYYKDADGNYRYISQNDKYFAGDNVPGDQSETDRNIYENDGEGGMYGDGHLTFSEGFRCGELHSYGFAGKTAESPRVVNTLQRMDMLRLTDCAISLLGARDYTAGQISVVPYSIARIGEMQMIAENVRDSVGNVVTSSEYALNPNKAAKRSRNYIALNNNIHFCGAIYSNVSFNDEYRNRSGEIKDASQSYRQRKQNYINNYSNAKKASTEPDEQAFQQRNDGTSANCIGIASGYALKLQNVYTAGSGDDDAASVEQLFYGPIVGVAEIELINIQEGEGGGYVYADNIHHRKSNGTSGSARRRAISVDTSDVPEDIEGTEDFLETSGNFVFPFNASKPRWVVDDCFPTEYYTHLDPDATSTKTTGDADNSLETGAHYWYVTGHDYYYYASITGYTFNSSADTLTFDSKSIDDIIQFTGLKKGQEVNFRRMTWHSGHGNIGGSDKFVACDLESLDPKATDQLANALVSEEKEHFKYANYNLSMSTGENKGVYSTSGTAYWNNLPLHTGMPTDSTRMLSSALLSDSPDITFQLVDAADNAASGYYDKYLSQTCKGTLLFSAKSLDKKGNQVYDYMPITEFYRGVESGDSIQYIPVTDGKLVKGATYYFMNNLGEYNALTFEENDSICGVFTRTLDDDDNVIYTHQQKETDVDVTGSYYTLAPRYYTYTIYLTINYVQGPSSTGGLKIYNCALPGEMIKIDKGDIVLHADKSMPKSATYWRIGKRHKNGGIWALSETKAENTETPAFESDVYYEYDPSNAWDSTKVVSGVDNNETSRMLKDVHYDETDDYILVPAYYFMNGFGVQYCYKVYGTNKVFTVDINDQDTLTIHNYHRMQPRTVTGGAMPLNLHIDMAAQRAKSETSFAQPRVYITDNTDLKAFAACMRNTVDADVRKEKGDSVLLLGTAPGYGANMQFFLQKDVAVANGYVAPEFHGTFNGNGHVISGLASGSGLFQTLGTDVNIYNLGLPTGVITVGDAVAGSGKYADNSKYHCCYTYAPVSASSDADSKHVVYRMDGTAFTGYSEADWRYGKVAYDLNQYYLDKRYHVGGGTASAAQTYVESLYANGDYLYADFSGSNNYDGSEFLRTMMRPNYLSHDVLPSGGAVTRHNTSHTIDKSRAVGYTPASGSVEESCKGYQPLFNASSISSSAASSDPVKNDYIFFGQILDADTKDADAATVNSTIPDAITENPETATAYHCVSGMTNRMYRAGGYYESTVDNGYYYNADAYAHDNNVTAIDFYGYDRQTYTNNMNIGGHVGESVAGESIDFYSPISDYGLSSLTTDDGVTRNLLVYARDANARSSELSTLNYTENTLESLIKAHIVDHASTAVNGTTATTALLHLVERATTEDANNDFCCPNKFNVTKKAWYTRKPAYYAETRNSAWEGICLPFSVNNVSASYNGEISHFYGTATGASADAGTAVASGNTGHEYWLRGLTSITDNKASFQRPGEGMFAQGTVTGSYTYSNSHFQNVYGDIYENGSIYATPRTFDGYYFQQSGVPYIVSFPGSTFMEFDLSGEYNRMLMEEGDHSMNWDADNNDSHEFSSLPDEKQNVTFAWICANDDKTPNTKGTLTIPVDVLATTTVGDYIHQGTYVAIDDAKYGVNADGTAFDMKCNTVLPFRTYMSTSSSASGAKYSAFRIWEETGIQELPQQGTETVDDGLNIYSKERSIIVESSYQTVLYMYTSAGQLSRVLDVIPGKNTYTCIPQGIYIIDHRKLYVK